MFVCVCVCHSSNSYKYLGLLEQRIFKSNTECHVTSLILRLLVTHSSEKIGSSTFMRVLNAVYATRGRQTGIIPRREEARYTEGSVNTPRGSETTVYKKNETVLQERRRTPKTFGSTFGVPTSDKFSKLIRKYEYRQMGEKLIRTEKLKTWLERYKLKIFCYSTKKYSNLAIVITC